ncbi:hypothetical protein PENSPDRAFT_63980 [Peniophora sp. CONT]|nr:hypothetical protein PENSPDRAFT_63980 [Peniophora sp. CONT]
MTWPKRGQGSSGWMIINKRLFRQSRTRDTSSSVFYYPRPYSHAYVAISHGFTNADAGTRYGGPFHAAVHCRPYTKLTPLTTRTRETHRGGPYFLPLAWAHAGHGHASDHEFLARLAGSSSSSCRLSETVANDGRPRPKTTTSSAPLAAAPKKCETTLLAAAERP